MNVTGNVKESEVEKYLCERVAHYGGDTRKLQYVGRRGCADRLVVFYSLMYLVETKKPKGGVVSKHQDEDFKWLMSFGIRKRYVYTFADVDQFIGDTGVNEE